MNFLTIKLVELFAADIDQKANMQCDLIRIGAPIMEPYHYFLRSQAAADKAWRTAQHFYRARHLEFFQKIGKTAIKFSKNGKQLLKIGKNELPVIKLVIN